MVCPPILSVIPLPNKFVSIAASMIMYIYINNIFNFFIGGEAFVANEGDQFFFFTTNDGVCIV